MSHGTGKLTVADASKGQVVDFNQVRAQRLEEKRRKTERVFFKNLIAVYSLMGNTTMCPIDLIDVSEEGCSFQVPFDPANPWPADLAEIPIRLYFSQDTFLEVRVRIEHSRPSIENHSRYTRFGCSVDQTTTTYETYRQFVRFLKLYAEFAQKDKGDVTIFYL